MSLFLTGDREHALLALVIQEARQEAKVRGGFVGRTAVQKLMYFLKVIGVPMSYRFEIHHYGPFCDDILRDVEWLAADGVIVDRSEHPQKYSDYAPAEATEELLDMHRPGIESYREKARSVVRAFVPLRPERLELIATLDYLYRKRKASGGPGPWKASVIESFHEIKKGKFQEAEVTQAYDAMVRAGLIGL